MKRIFIIAFFCLSMGQVIAQNENDALRASQYGLFGTASYVGRAGAIGALGGDATAATYNPAGLGVYRSSEIFMSTSLHLGYSNSNYFNSKANDFRTSFYWAPVGAVFVVPNSDKNSDWKIFQAGISYNRLGSFNNATSIYGKNPNSSITDSWISQSNGKYPDQLNPYSTQLAFRTYLLDTIPGSGGTRYRSSASVPSLQSCDFSERGGIDEFAFSFSGNYKDFLYLGATLGIPYYSYERNSIYTEYLNDRDPSFDYQENLVTNGWGINLKVGAIMRPVNWLRIGLAVHTPTFYSLCDESYTTDLVDYYEGVTVLSPVSVPYEYNLITPFKVLGSIGATFGDQNSVVAGSFGVDYEYSNYSFMAYQMEDNRYENDVNDVISNIYQAGHVLRAGGSLNIGKAIIRAGYAYFGSPYENNKLVESGTNAGDKNAFTLGVGYKSRIWYIDFAYAYTQQEMNYFMYDSYYQQKPAKVTKSENLFITTVGVKF